MDCFVLEKFDSKIESFLKENGIVQQELNIKEIFKDEKYEYKIIVCKDDEEIIGAFPFVLFNGKYGKVINSMPIISYGGIVAKNISENLYKAIIDELIKFSIQNDVITYTVCTIPFKNDYKIYKKVIKPDFEFNNFFQFIDLKKDVYSNMTSKFRGNLRRNLKKSEKFGVTLVEDYSLETLEKWYYSVYLDRMIETGCIVYPIDVFKAIMKNAKNNKSLILYAYINEELIGGGIYLNQISSLDDFMRVVNSKYFYTQVGTLMDDYAIKYAIKLEKNYFNWQSCDSIDSNIYKYKQAWGSEVGEHFYLTKIVGDIEKIRNIKLEEVKEEYKGIFVLPYSELK